jgi:hypothetical protein
MLSHHWIRDKEVFAHERLRVQLAANLILAGATATRPGALIGQLLYQHLEFQLFPPLPGEQRPRVVLKVNLKHIKRSGGESEPKEFAFREDDMLLYDPLIPVMALAFADDAFANKFKDLGAIYQLVVPANTDRLRLPWKDEWLNRPVFRDIESSPQGIQVADEKALSYSQERKHLVRLGRSVGLEKTLEWYDLRRGSGKRLNGKTIPPTDFVLMLTADRSTYAGGAQQDYGSSSGRFKRLRTILHVQLQRCRLPVNLFRQCSTARFNTPRWTAASPWRRSNGPYQRANHRGKPRSDADKVPPETSHGAGEDKDPVWKPSSRRRDGASREVRAVAEEGRQRT